MTVAARPLPVRGALPAGRELPPRRALPPAVAAPRLTSGTGATLLGRVPVGASAALFTLAVDAPLSGYRAGQYVAVGLLSDGALVQRPYSVVAVGSGGEIELLIRHVAGGGLTPRMWQLAAGTRLHVGPARGAFVLQPGDGRRHLLIGAGTGVAPLLSMAADLAGRANRPVVTLIHGVAYADELCFAERIRAWRGLGLPIDYRPTVSRPDDPANAGWNGLVGRAETQLAEILREPDFAASGSVAYVCGNPGMVEASTVLLARFLAPAAIRVERF